MRVQGGVAFCLLAVMALAMLPVKAGYAAAQESATITGSEPPEVATPPAPSGKNLVDAKALSSEIEELDARLKVVTEKIGLAQTAKTSWDQTSQRVREAIASHAGQAAACHQARAELKKRKGEGAPDWALADGLKHTSACDDRASRYKAMLTKIETEIQKLLEQVKYIEGSIAQYGIEKEETLRSKSVLEQTLGIGVNKVKNAVDSYKKAVSN